MKSLNKKTDNTAPFINPIEKENLFVDIGNYYSKTQLLNSLMNNKVSDTQNLINNKNITKLDKFDTSTLPYKIRKGIEFFILFKILLHHNMFSDIKNESLNDNQNFNYYITTTSLLHFCQVNNNIIQNLEEKDIDEKIINQIEEYNKKILFEYDEHLIDIPENIFLLSLAFFYNNVHILEEINKKEPEFFQKEDTHAMINSELSFINLKKDSNYPKECVHWLIKQFPKLKKSMDVSLKMNIKDKILICLIEKNDKDKFLNIIENKIKILDIIDILIHYKNKTKLTLKTFSWLEEYDLNHNKKITEEFVNFIFFNSNSFTKNKESYFFNDLMNDQNFQNVFYNILKKGKVNCPFNKIQMKTVEDCGGQVNWEMVSGQLILKIKRDIKQHKKLIVFEEIYKGEMEFLCQDNMIRFYKIDKDNKVSDFLIDNIRKNKIKETETIKNIILKLKNKKILMKNNKAKKLL